MTFDEKYRKRAEVLLGLRHQEDEILPADANPSPAALGAQAGLGYAWKSSSVRASVYLFDSYDNASAAEKRLQADPPGDQVASTINGPLLMWATADRDDDGAGDILLQLRESFAGRERDRE
jgi:hypothetical protein